MSLSEFLNRKRPPLDGGTGEGVSPLSGDLAGNEAVRRKQRLLLTGVACGGLILAYFWIFSGGDREKLDEDGDSEEVDGVWGGTRVCEVVDYWGVALSIK